MTRSPLALAPVLLGCVSSIELMGSFLVFQVPLGFRTIKGTCSRGAQLLFRSPGPQAHVWLQRPQSEVHRALNGNWWFKWR